jgi:biotin synthase-like enzyme
MQKEYNPDDFVRIKDVSLSSETKELMSKASVVYSKNFPATAYAGRCIFLSWYCSIADCDFCYRSVIKHKQGNPKKAKRSMGSVLLEALFSKTFDWPLEFITGGLGIMPFPELVEHIKAISDVYGSKVWLNLGGFSEEQIEELRPYVEGVCGSMETLHPKLHDETCPSKPIKPFSDMFKKLKGFRKSIAVIVGLGDSYSDIHYLLDFIKEHELDRITMYPLKPVRGTRYTTGPSTDEFLKWMSRVRVEFPKIEIVAGTNLRRAEESGLYMKAGANGITKFPLLKEFGNESSIAVKKLIEDAGREFVGNITEQVDVDWEKEINALPISDAYKEQMLNSLPLYLAKFGGKKKLKVIANCEC